jgi:hypothetical protein
MAGEGAGVRTPAITPEGPETSGASNAPATTRDEGARSSPMSRGRGAGGASKASSVTGRRGSNSVGAGEAGTRDCGAGAGPASTRGGRCSTSRGGVGGLTTFGAGVAGGGGGGGGVTATISIGTIAGTEGAGAASSAVMAPRPAT